MSLDRLFNPSSIVIVGVSRDPKKVGYLVAKNLLEQGFTGETYFINKNDTQDILGKKVYRNIQEIQKPIDLAVLAIPAHAALPYFEELAQAGIKNVVLFAAGFKEVGENGESNETQLIDQIKKYEMNLLGPNCIGFINTALQVNTTFLKHSSPVGNIGFISQSGALGSVMVDYFAGHKNQGFSYFISLGNKTSLDETDGLEFLLEDKNTVVIGLYLEDVKNGKKFTSALQKAVGKKPIIVLKSGRTAAGSKAALSHTGGLVGDDQVYNAIFKQYGVIRAESFSEFTTLLKLYSYGKLPKNNTVIVISNAGGVGVLFADELIENKLQLPLVSSDAENKIVSANITKKPILHNPIDLLGDATAFDFKHSIESLKNEKNIGAVCVLLTPQANTQVDETAIYLIEEQNSTPFPLYPIFMGEASVHTARNLFEQNKMATFVNYDLIPICLKKVLWQQSFIFSLPSSPSLIQSLAFKAQENTITTILQKWQGRPFVNLPDSLTVFKQIGILTVPLMFIDSLETLERVSKTIQFPVVLKIASDIVTHKTEVGGVMPNIKSLDELRESFTHLVSSGKSKGAYVQSMVSGYEVFIGAKRDINFGVVIVVGLGGIYAELLKEVSYRVYPFSLEEFSRMLSETKLHKLLSGFRGSSPIDSAKLYEIVSNIGMCMEQFPQIKEIDINPLFITASSLLVVDGRIITS